MDDNIRNKLKKKRKKEKYTNVIFAFVEGLFAIIPFLFRYRESFFLSTTTLLLPLLSYLQSFNPLVDFVR